MTRQLRSLAIGDHDLYASPYLHRVAQAMGRLGHIHSTVNIRQPVDVIARRVLDVRPDILWTHMFLWAPPGSPRVEQLVSVATDAARRGAKVVIHDGDYKEQTRHPADISGWASVALCNHTFSRAAWRVPQLRWPYFAFAQDQIATPDPSLACDLFFAGTIGAGPVYATRSAFLRAVQSRGVGLRLPSPADGNTLFRTASYAASATCVLGFGRPGVKGWVDTRVFQYPGAGAILLHDDAAGYLEPGVHYVPYRSGDAESVADAVARVKAMPAAEQRAMRERAFAYVQERHSSVARVVEVLRFLGLASPA